MTTFEDSGDVWNIYTFGYHEWVYSRDQGSFPHNEEQLGRFIGPLRNEGNEMTQSVVTHKAIVLPRCTMRKFTWSELHDESEKVRRIKYKFKIKATFGYSISISPKPKVWWDWVGSSSNSRTQWFCWW